jgi:hypothetical protein
MGPSVPMDLASDGFDASGKGFCLVTYRPMELCHGARNGFDFLLALPGEHGIEPPTRTSVAAAAGIGAERLGPELTGTGRGQALLVRRGPPTESQVFSLAPRWVAHVRHWHKYAGARLPTERRFYFRDDHALTGVAAANLAEFHHELRRCAEDVLYHHAAGSDFSRWIQDVIQDSSLADAVQSIERRLEGAATAHLGGLRSELLEAIERRYLG